MFLLRPGVWSDGLLRAPEEVNRPAAGLRILVPGYVQWSWRQPERALVLFGSYVMALGVGVLTWGTWFGLVVLAFAFGTHVVAVLDVIRQSAFPGFGRWMPVFSASGGLAVAFYAPALVVASFVAWPVTTGGRAADGYLVNCWAYRGALPAPGDRVWLRSSPWGELHVGRVVAGPGQEVEWSRQQFRVNGEPVKSGLPFRSAVPPEQLTYRIPEGYVLVNPGADFPGEVSSSELVLVSRDQIKGRVWARAYPVWDRQFLR